MQPNIRSLGGTVDSSKSVTRYSHKDLEEHAPIICTKKAITGLDEISCSVTAPFRRVVQQAVEWVGQQ